MDGSALWFGAAIATAAISARLLVAVVDDDIVPPGVRKIRNRVTACWLAFALVFVSGYCVFIAGADDGGGAIARTVYLIGCIVIAAIITVIFSRGLLRWFEARSDAAEADRARNLLAILERFPTIGEIGGADSEFPERIEWLDAERVRLIEAYRIRVARYERDWLVKEYRAYRRNGPGSPPRVRS